MWCSYFNYYFLFNVLKLGTVLYARCLHFILRWPWVMFAVFVGVWLPVIQVYNPSFVGDDESIGSGKSSNRSRTPQPGSQPIDSQINSTATYNTHADLNFPNGPILNAQQFHPSSRKRKNGIIGRSQFYVLVLLTRIHFIIFWPCQLLCWTSLPTSINMWRLLNWWIL